MTHWKFDGFKASAAIHEFLTWWKFFRICRVFWILQSCSNKISFQFHGDMLVMHFADTRQFNSDWLKLWEVQGMIFIYKHDQFEFSWAFVKCTEIVRWNITNLRKDAVTTDWLGWKCKVWFCLRLSWLWMQLFGFTTGM